MIDGQQIGCGIATCRRPAELQRLWRSLPHALLDHIIIVNDGEQPLSAEYAAVERVNNPRNLGVGKTKNIAMRWLLAQGAEHIFILEDDIFIRDHDIFARYIRASKQTGIEHFNFCPFGPAPLNRDPLGRPAPVAQLALGPDLGVDFYAQLVAPLSYFSRACLEQVGLYDERFYNAMEHVEHSLRIVLQGLHPPFYFFADVSDSHQAIGGDDWAPAQSAIQAINSDRDQLIAEAYRQFEQIYGWSLQALARPGIGDLQAALASMAQRRAVCAVDKDMM